MVLNSWVNCFALVFSCEGRALEMKHLRTSFAASLFWSLVVALSGCEAQEAVPQVASRGAVIQSKEWDELYGELAAVIERSTVKTMSGNGTVGCIGGGRFKIVKTGTHLVTMPLPQMVDGQVPVSFCIRSTPSNAVVEYRVERRNESNDILSVKLKGNRGQEVQLEWASVVLIAGKPESRGQSLPDAYRAATACVQSDSPEIQALAEKLWPATGDIQEYARNIQQFIRDMKQRKPPRSLDALSILDSGMNGVCTANANLALALLRAKGIPSRSMAVIPPNGQRLEMHRIVEYSENARTFYFDPSSVSADVPMQPWQTMIMAKSTIADEDLSMKPRMGVMLGCPYGQEAELPEAGIVFTGQDMFWTMAKPLAEFEPSEAAVSVAREAWTNFLKEGVMKEEQIHAAQASDSDQLTRSLGIE
ncbi:MAG: transglutaminase domain-containing protein [Planctomycetes bacterium]|nr:transglutaminase domain-containing protein [Planctomycetota bacterium]